jgi:hypothetical protein
MFLQRWLFTLLVCLLPQLCMGQAFQIDPRSESLYQQAVPYLQKANSKLDAVPADFPTATAEERKRAVALVDDARALLQPAITLLEQAAALDHPVAQYRLALIYVMMIYPSEVIKEKSCPLFERSLIHGFAPSALEFSNWCWERLDKAQYQAALQAIESSMPMYEQYYPQPTVEFNCRREQAQGMAMQWGGSRDYQAEIYQLLGQSDRKLRGEFFQKAIDINDCYRAKSLLGGTQ